MQCVCTNLWTVQALSFWVGLFLGPALTRQSGSALTFRLPLLFLQILPILCFLLFHFSTMLTGFDHLLSLPAEMWTPLIEAHPHVHCEHYVVHVHLDHRSISNIANVRILFIQHNNASSSDNFLH